MYVDVVHLLEMYWVLGLGHGSVFLRYLYYFQRRLMQML